MILEPRGIVNGSDNGLGVEILVKSIQAKILSETAHLVPAERAIVVEGEVAIDPNTAGSD